MKYIIVNTFDKPCPKLLAEVVNNKAYYMSRATIPNMKNFDGMEIVDGTPIEDFGFEIVETPISVHFKQTRPSTAKYDNNTIRQWQGETSFTLPRINLTK